MELRLQKLINFLLYSLPKFVSVKMCRADLLETQVRRVFKLEILWLAYFCTLCL